MIQRELQKLFVKEMNRQEFLAHVGAGVLTVIGITGLVKHLSNFNNGGPARTLGEGNRGYGLSNYWGKKK